MSAAPKDPLDPLYTDMVSVLKTDKNKFIELVMVGSDAKAKTAEVTAEATDTSSAEDKNLTKFAFLMKTWRKTVHTILDAEIKKKDEKTYEKHKLAIIIVNSNGDQTAQEKTAQGKTAQEKQTDQAKHILALGIMCELKNSIEFFQNAKIVGDANMGQLEAVLNTLKN